MSKPIVLTDWDGTIRRGFTIRSWVSHLTDAGVVSGILADEIALFFGQYATGAISHDDLALRVATAYAAHLTDVETSILAEQIGPFVSADRVHLMPKALTLLEGFRCRGNAVVVVSGAPREILEAYRAPLGLHEIFALELDVGNARYSGTVQTNPAISSVKASVVESLSESSSIRIVAAMGNSLSDVPLFRAAPVQIVVGAPHLLDEARHATFYLTDTTDVTAIFDALDRGGLEDG